MRPLLVLSFALSFVSSTAPAQTIPPTPSRWTLSAGPEWGFPSLWGLRVRADYDLVGRTSPVRLRLQAGALWGPTQRFYHAFGGGSEYYGMDQTVDLTFGVVAAISPVPRARMSPYLTIGVLARQAWSHGWTQARNAAGSTFSAIPEATRMFGDVIIPVGLGIRANIGGRSFQLEIRRLYGGNSQGFGMRNSLTFGTSLPFE